MARLHVPGQWGEEGVGDPSTLAGKGEDLFCPWDLSKFPQVAGDMVGDLGLPGQRLASSPSPA